MRNARALQYPVFYKLYEGETEITDQYGNATGSFAPNYSGLKSILISVSPNKGDSEETQYGTSLEYTRTMSIADPKCEIDEKAVLWLDDADTDGPWNYQVVAVARSKHITSYAVQRVDVTTHKDTTAASTVSDNADN